MFFFISDYFKTTELSLGNFDVHTFDKIIDSIKSNKNNLIIRTHHSPWYAHRKYLKENNTLISECPDNYLNLYANAAVMYSDRVHACVAVLAFGVEEKLTLSKDLASTTF